MGCSPGDSDCLDNEKPLRTVTISKGFWMGQTPVTQEAYENVMGKNPSHFKGAQRPVEGVTWDDANEYCRRAGGRLPTEAEWEYGARAGTSGARYGDLERIGWYEGNSPGETKPVRRLQSNPWGLYDMLGNVWEWTRDWYEGYDSAEANDPAGPATGEERVLRGGAWLIHSPDVRVSYRGRNRPSYRSNFFGFRCALELR